MYRTELYFYARSFQQFGKYTHLRQYLEFVQPFHIFHFASVNSVATWLLPHLLLPNTTKTQYLTHQRTKHTLHAASYHVHSIAYSRPAPIH